MSAHDQLYRFSRRTFLVGAAGSAALAATGGLGALVSGPVLAARPAPATRNPLYIPPTRQPTNFPLTAAPGTVDLGGQQSRAWVYNGGLPGPTFEARTGDTATITLTNGLSTEETITHWHGMLVSHENDGHPMEAIGPGQSYLYDFPIRNRAALNWYHPHPHMLTGEQVAMGLAGAFIIRDAVEDALGLPGGAHEVTLVLRDTDLDNSGNIVYRPRSGGWLGSHPLVNGTLRSYFNVDTALYRFRVLGGANARIFRLALSPAASFTLIGNDGGLLANSVSLTSADIAPGERLDLLVDFRGLPVGSKVILRELRANWDLLEFRVVRQVSDGSTIPTALSTITPLSGPSAVTRHFSFDGMTKINGLEYDMNRIDFQVPFNEVERWQFTTNGNAPHPVHVHGASFQVQSRSGGRKTTFPWETGWKDTVLLEDRETVQVLVRFDAYRGIYLMHCHKLEHEDMGMMSNFEVV